MFGKLRETNNSDPASLEIARTRSVSQWHSAPDTWSVSPTIGASACCLAPTHCRQKTKLLLQAILSAFVAICKTAHKNNAQTDFQHWHGKSLLKIGYASRVRRRDCSSWTSLVSSSSGSAINRSFAEYGLSEYLLPRLDVSGDHTFFHTFFHSLLKPLSFFALIVHDAGLRLG